MLTTTGTCEAHFLFGGPGLRLCFLGHQLPKGNHGGGRLYVNDPGGWPADQRLIRELREKIPTMVLLPKGDLLYSGPGNLCRTSH